MIRYFKRGHRGADYGKMIGKTSGASRFNIDKFSEIVGLQDMEKVLSKRDDFIVIVLSSFLSQCRDLDKGVICSVLGFSVTARAR